MNFFYFPKPQWEYKFGNLKFSDYSNKRFSNILNRSHSQFYSLVYSDFITNIGDYDGYSSRFKAAKKQSAVSVADWISGKKTLSYGCGTAYVEEVYFPDENITLFDESSVSSFGKRRIVSSLSNIDLFYDAILAIQLVFHMNHLELEKFFIFSSSRLGIGGFLIITHSPSSDNFLVNIYDIAFNLWNIFTKSDRKYVLWGWRRSSSFYTCLASKFGFKLLELKVNPVNKEHVMLFQLDR